MRKKITIEMEVEVDDEDVKGLEVAAHNAMMSEAKHFADHDFGELMNDNQGILITSIASLVRIDDVA